MYPKLKAIRNKKTGREIRKIDCEEGELSEVEQAIEIVKREIFGDNVTSVALVATFKDGRFATSFSFTDQYYHNDLGLLGAIEILKSRLLINIDENRNS
jgi:hypothetical protein